ncbi:MAG: hypothetical protein H6Q52_3256 [Deltaproteobacteria bacterium]|nr:hypothetical protein [Deltaproteobacteria bacterium]
MKKHQEKYTPWFKKILPKVPRCLQSYFFPKRHSKNNDHAWYQHGFPITGISRTF